MVREAGNRPDLQTGLAQNIILSADLLAFFLPSEMHPLWGEWATTIANNFTTTTSERLIFAGFVPLALTFFIIWWGWREIIVKFWTLIAGFFFLLALGPFLHINGQMITLGSWPIPLPYLFLYYTVPFIGLTRSLSRYDLMVMLALGILTSLALTKLQHRLTSDRSPPLHNRHYVLRNSLPFIAVLLICLEFLAIPYPISPIETPRFYHDLARDLERYTIAELPMNWDRPTPLLQQTVHQKGLLTAYTSRNNPRELAWRIPVLQHWRYLDADIIDQPLEIIAPTIFFDFNLRYIVLDYWQMPPGPEREGTERWVAAALPGLEPVYDDGRLRVYQTPPKNDTQPYLSLGAGWSDRQPSTSGIRRELTTPYTELFLHHPQNQPLTLELSGASRRSPQSITLLAQEQKVTTINLHQDFSTQIIQLPPFSNPLVTLKFIPDESGEAIQIKRVALRR